MINFTLGKGQTLILHWYDVPYRGYDRFIVEDGAYLVYIGNAYNPSLNVIANQIIIGGTVTIEIR